VTSTRAPATTTVAAPWGDRVDALDWDSVRGELDRYGCALTGPLLTAKQPVLVHVGGFDQGGPVGHVLRLSGTEYRRQDSRPERRDHAAPGCGTTCDPTSPAPPVTRTRERRTLVEPTISS
jgi:hypothetical protein